MQSVATSLEYSKENLEELCTLGSENEKNGQVIIPIGKRSGGIILENFASISSSLIVGTTGSGKSSFVKTAIIEMMQKYTPDQVKFVIYDSRRIDYSFLNANPFLLVPVICEAHKATGLIQWSLIEARKRMNNLDQIEKFPHIFIILDDFSEMAPSNDTFSDLVQLLQVARRAKIHCWIVTSTPSSNILPTDLKANINHKISFRVTSKSISRIVLDDVGAETLNVPGEIIVKINNDIVKCESVYLDDSDIEDCSKAAIEKYSVATPTLPIVSNASDRESNMSDPFIGEDGKDALYKQAVDVVLETQIASVSMIQRRLKLGYSRAARLIDQMEADGLVGQFEGSKPRTILVTLEQWHNLQGDSQLSGNTRTDTSKQTLSVRQTVKDQRLTLAEQSVVLGTGYTIRTSGSNVVVLYNGKESTIVGRSITELFYRKPGLFRKGSLSIHFSVSSLEDTVKTEHRTFDIPFDSKDSNCIKAFCKQLSKDIMKTVIEL